MSYEAVNIGEETVGLSDVVCLIAAVEVVWLVGFILCVFFCFVLFILCASDWGTFLSYFLISLISLTKIFGVNFKNQCYCIYLLTQHSLWLQRSNFNFVHYSFFL